MSKPFPPPPLYPPPDPFTSTDDEEEVEEPKKEQPVQKKPSSSDSIQTAKDIVKETPQHPQRSGATIKAQNNQVVNIVTEEPESEDASKQGEKLSGSNGTLGGGLC